MGRNFYFTKKNDMTRLALGTAQFGNAYGVANRGECVSQIEARSIIDNAHQSGINTIDTAIAYGNSEQRLGEIGVNNFKVITKLPEIPLNCDDIFAWIFQNLTASLKRLNLTKLEGLLLHKPSQLFGAQGQEIYDALARVKSEGLVNKIGVSIYSPLELNSIIQTFDIVQAPLNLIDRRLVTSGWLQRLHKKGVEVHIRSVFLQGLLLMKRGEIPVKFERWSTTWNTWHNSLAQNNLSALTACLQYPLSLPEVDRVIVGVDNAAQLLELVDSHQINIPQHDWESIACDDEELINPSKWNQL